MMMFKKEVFIFFIVCLSTISFSAISGGMSEREKAFVKDYKSIFNKYIEFDSYSFKMDGNSHDTKSIKMDVVTNPPLVADKKIYYINGYVRGKENGLYISDIIINSNKYYFSFSDKIETLRGKENLGSLKINEGISIIGRLVDLVSYKTVLGVEKKMPVFQALHIEQCQPSTYWDKNYCAIYD